MTDWYRPSVIDRIYRVMVSVGMVAAFALLALVAWWLFYPYRGLSVYHFDMLTPQVRAGELLHYQVSYCLDATTPMPARVDREMVLQNHVVSFPIPDIGYMIQQPCESKTRVIGIPTYAPPGIYHLEISTTMEPNPLRTVRQSWRSPTFEVIK